MKINKILLAICVIVLLAGCAAKTMVYKTFDGGKIEVGGNAGNGWCTPGSDWKMGAMMDEGYASVKWTVVEAMEDGKYTGACHVLLEAVDEDGTEARVDYYFGKSGTLIGMNVQGRS